MHILTSLKNGFLDFSQFKIKNSILVWRITKIIKIKKNDY